MRNLNIILITVLTLLVSGVTWSQKKDTIKPPSSIQEREMAILNQQWGLTDNSAGMGYNRVATGSFATLGLFMNEGDYHRAQEGSSNQGLEFRTERYDSFNEKIFVKGSFAFVMDSEKERAWSDVFHTYNSNPFIFGSSVKGDYETQKFDLNVKIFTAPIGRFNFGVTVDYHVADMSRQRDPRSRSYLLDYSLIPSISYSIDKRNFIGLNAYYRMEKETMPGLTTIQTDPNLKYYTFTGLEHIEGKIGGYKGFERQFLSDITGGAVQYNYSGDRDKFIIALGVDAQWLQSLGDKKQSPGSYNEFTYKVVSNLLMNRKYSIHDFVLRASIKDGGANEFRQSLESNRDPITGNVTETWITNYTYINRYVVKTADIFASWRMLKKVGEDKGYNWSFGSQVAYSQFENYYYLPSSSYSVGKFYAGINGSKVVDLNRGKRLELSAKAILGLKTSSSLTLGTESEISSMILDTDLAFHDRTTTEIAGNLRFTFPLNLGKNIKALGYARLDAGNIFADGSQSWFSTRFSIGILTL